MHTCPTYHLRHQLPPAVMSCVQSVKARMRHVIYVYLTHTRVSMKKCVHCTISSGLKNSLKRASTPIWSSWGSVVSSAVIFWTAALESWMLACIHEAHALSTTVHASVHTKYLSRKKFSFNNRSWKVNSKSLLGLLFGTRDLGWCYIFKHMIMSQQNYQTNLI